MPTPIISCTRLNCARLATGPCVVCGERGSPTTKRGCRLAREPLDLREAFARHDHAGRRAAGLADVAHAGRHRGRYGACEIRIGQDDVGRLAAEFLGHALDGRRGRLRHQHAGPGGAGDRDHVHVGVRRQRGADLRPVAVDEVEHTRRNAGVVHHFGEQQGAQGRQLAGLQNDGASRRQRGADLGGDLVERPVPGRDQAAHADGLAHDGRVAAMGEERIAAREVAGHADVLRRNRHLCAARDADGAAHLQRDRLGKQLRPLEDQGVDAVEKRGPALRRNSRTRSRRRAAPRPRPRRRPARLPNAISATGSSVDGSMTERGLALGQDPLAADEDAIQTAGAPEALDDGRMVHGLTIHKSGATNAACHRAPALRSAGNCAPVAQAWFGRMRSCMPTGNRCVISRSGSPARDRIPCSWFAPLST